jgi:hypothetical protein
MNNVNIYIYIIYIYIWRYIFVSSMSILAQALTSNRTHASATDYLIYAPDDASVDSSYPLFHRTSACR